MPMDDDETALSRPVASTATLKLASLHSLAALYQSKREGRDRVMVARGKA